MQVSNVRAAPTRVFNEAHVQNVSLRKLTFTSMGIRIHQRELLVPPMQAKVANTACVGCTDTAPKGTHLICRHSVINDDLF